MAAKRAPLPPIARSVTPLEWVVVLSCWLILAIASAEPLHRQLSARGVPLTINDLRIGQAIDWAVWGVLLPVAFATLDRLPLRCRVWPKHLVGWIAAAFVFGAVHAVLSWPLIQLAANLLGIPPQALSAPELRLTKLALDDAENFNLLVFAYVALQWVHRGRAERARAREVERSLRDARLHALALELQPHFLFNTLNGIAALVRSDPRTAERMVVTLSDLLRLTLDSGKAGQLPLHEELRQLELYLGLQQMRHGSRLTVRKEVPGDVETARVPPMLLQPLVENALSHGIGGRPGPGTLDLRAWREGDRLWLAVEDDGIGMPADGPAQEGVGLSNTRARLAALYPDEHEFRIEPRPEGGTRVLIRMPYQADGIATGAAT
ncbi:MAG TPA: histidine kinase [Gemmatimonadales bacterium]|jgi:sensor histidine kinase YesM